MLLFNNGPHPDTNYFDCLWCSNNLSSKMGHSRLLFLYFCLFNKIDRKQMFHKILMMDDWSRTADLWCRKRPLYQLSHNHCPSKQFSQIKNWRLQWNSTSEIIIMLSSAYTTKTTSSINCPFLYFFIKMDQPRPLLCLFSPFQTRIKILQQIGM